MPFSRPMLCQFLFLTATICTLAGAQTREEKVRADKAKVEKEGFWIYNDLEEALEQGKQTGKPILVALRCIPCEECVKLDDDLIDNDPAIKPLLEKFVCVRIVGTNGLDLDTFQYDTDQSFAMFMLNAEKTIYGRFGTRSHRTDWVGDVSVEGMARALEGALALHAEYPKNKRVLASKRGKPLEFSSPELYPSMKEKYTDSLNYEGNVVKSCIHCHQIGDARREYYWNASKPIPDDLLYPYPHPKSIGLVLDPAERAKVKSVTESSPAAAAKLAAGDEILTMNQQPLLSMADVQWVLHNLSNSETDVSLTIRRGDTEHDLSLHLPHGWKQLDETDWRVSSWVHCRMALGGMRLEPLTTEERKAAGLENGMALRVRSLGRYNMHATARRRGFREGDVLVKYAGQSDFQREADLFAYCAKEQKAGNTVSIEFIRDGKRQELRLPIQR